MRETITLVKDNKDPLAEQLRDQIEMMIRTGKLSTGDRLPSFREFSRQFGVSMGTVRQAIQVMKAQGILEVRHGRGVFVGSSAEKTLNVALICPALGPENFNRIVMGINEVFSGQDIRLILKMAPKAYQNELEYISDIDPAEYDGCLIVPPANNDCSEAFRTLNEKKIPFVLIDTIPGDMSVNAVTTDCRLQGFLAVNHLINKGHRRIGIVDHSGMAVTGQLRREGFQAALATIGESLETIPYARVPLMDPEDSTRFCRREIVVKHIEKVLLSEKKITGVVGIHANMTSVIMNKCQELGLKVPNDLSVIGLGDSKTIANTYPTVTIVDTTPERLGMRAARRLLEILKNRNAFAEKISIPPVLVENLSVREI